jgi:hypothetical protein
MLLFLYHRARNIDKGVFCYTQKNALPLSVKCTGIYKWYGAISCYVYSLKVGKEAKVHLANCKNGKIIVPKHAGLVALVAYGTSFVKNHICRLIILGSRSTIKFLM